MTTRAMTQQEYTEAWSLNAKQHFEDGDYEWLCDQLEPYHNILEIGCGAGYSTLVLTLRDHRVLSVDINPDALQKAKELIIENDYEAEIATKSINFDEKDVWLWNTDVVGNREALFTVTSQLPIDLILLCNPGGNLDPSLRMNEVKLLKRYGFSQAEIDQRCHQNAIPLLHKFSMIDAAADIALHCGKPLMIVERGDKEQVTETLEQISIDTGMRRIREDFHEIKMPPDGGITLGDVDGTKAEKLFWGAGMYFPD